MFGFLKAGDGYDIDDIYDKFINATFVWWEDQQHTKPYPLSPLVSGGEILSNNVLTNNDNEPISCFIVYKNLTCGIEQLLTLQGRTDILLAVGGIQLSPQISYKGFEKHNIPSLEYETQRIAICYNPYTNKIALVAHPEEVHIEVFRIKLLKLGFKYILGLDSGGSAQWSFEKDKRFTGRIMIGWLGW